MTRAEYIEFLEALKQVAAIHRATPEASRAYLRELDAKCERSEERDDDGLYARRLPT